MFYPKINLSAKDRCSKYSKPVKFVSERDIHLNKRNNASIYVYSAGTTTNFGV
jgi:hypothetical protein